MPKGHNHPNGTGKIDKLIAYHQRALDSLPERERHVLVLRYGLADGEPRTLEEIVRRLGLTRERVRQIELDSLKRLASLREMEAVS